MRENRSYGSEGGGTEINQSFLPLSLEKPKKCSTALHVGSQNVIGFRFQGRWLLELLAPSGRPVN
jgi:hypothetical protein